jgi:hypothetical protein
MTSTRRTTDHWKKRSMTTEGGKISDAHGLADQHSKNGYTTRCNLHAQCNSHKIPKTFITEIEKSILKFIWKHRTLQTVKANTEQKEKCWMHHNTWLQNILQSHSNKNCMVLAQKQTWKLVEQNRGPGYESTQVCSHNLQQNYQKHTI